MHRTTGPVRAIAVAVVTVTLVVTAACTGTSSSGGAAPSPGSTAGTTKGTAASAAPGTVPAPTTQAFTPVLADVPVAPIPFPGSDGKTHLVYELFVTNAAKATAALDRLTVADAATGTTVLTLDKAGMADALQLANAQKTDGSLAPAESGLVFLHVALDGAATVPKALTHHLSVTLPDAPPSRQQAEETVAPTVVDTRTVLQLGPPLKGAGYIAADGCCEAARHRRASLPINGSLVIAQRYAIDWEQIDDQGRIYTGERTDPASYVIFGKEAIAVGDGVVVKVVDGLPEQTPGTFPEDIGIEDADGNSVVIDLGGGNFVMYAHLQPGSPKVKLGDKVKRGDVLGLVGNSGNSVAPHLHLHLMDSPLPLAASGLPYTIDSYTITGQTVSTAAFDKAEAEGTPLEYTPVSPPTSHRNQYPMDQSIVTFGTSATPTTSK